MARTKFPLRRKSNLLSVIQRDPLAQYMFLLPRGLSAVDPDLSHLQSRQCTTSTTQEYPRFDPWPHFRRMRRLAGSSSKGKQQMGFGTG